MKKILFLLLTVALIATSASAAKKEKAPKKGKEPAQQPAPPAPDPYPTYIDDTFRITWGYTKQVNDAMKGQVTRRHFNLSSDRYDLIFTIEQSSKDTTYELHFRTSEYNFNAITDGLIFNTDGNRTILRTKNGTVQAIGTSLWYEMSFTLDKATFERLANAKEVFEYTPMVGDKYFTPVTLKGPALDAAKASMTRILNNDNLKVVA